MVALDRVLVDAAPVFNQFELDRIVEAVGAARGISRASLFRTIDRAIASGMLERLCRGVYLNLRRRTKAKYADATEYVRPGAVVSLQTVLGDAGLLDNFTTDMVTCVVPRPHERTSVTVPRGIRNFFFNVMAEPAALPEMGFPILDGEGYKRATPELAFCHWLYLSLQPRSEMTAPSFEIDMDRMSMKKIRAISEKIGIGNGLKTWLAGKKTRDASDDVRAHAATRFGI
ncbi:MAG: type IV toxin-antitoxin system AbiEi family antitoxin domain-containing protein [Azospirillum sp.]|nr:type IV toxin-antitoxin system AbiEi family antitoxin domain-containing protein [Azospirillum sp.]